MSVAIVANAPGERWIIPGFYFIIIVRQICVFTHRYLRVLAASSGFARDGASAATASRGRDLFANNTPVFDCRRSERDLLGRTAR